MARPGQVEYIDDLLESNRLNRRALAELADNDTWAHYETLPDDEASEVIEWLREYEHEA